MFSVPTQEYQKAKEGQNSTERKEAKQIISAPGMHVSSTSFVSMVPAMDDAKDASSKSANRIAPSGENIQRIGDGLATPKIIKAYVEPIISDLMALPLEGRFEQLKKSINHALSLVGVPPVTVERDTINGFGSFDPSRWSMSAPSDNLGTVDPKVMGELVGTFFHEARHAEQYFRVAQKNACENKTHISLCLEIKEDIRQVAEKTKQKYSDEASQILKNKTDEWAKSLKNPSEVLKPMEEAQKYLSFRIENHILVTTELIQEAKAFECDLNEHHAIDQMNYSSIEAKLESYHRSKFELNHLREKLYQCIKSYRNMPHEKDAHTVGWIAEDTYRTHRESNSFDEKYQNRIPDGDIILKMLNRINHSIDELKAIIQKAKKFKSSKSDPASASTSGSDLDSDDFDGLFEDTDDEKAIAMAKKKTGVSSGAEFDQIHSDALKFYREQAKKAELPEAKEPVTVQEFLPILKKINENFCSWEYVKYHFLKATSALIHRRDNF